MEKSRTSTSSLASAASRSQRTGSGRRGGSGTSSATTSLSRKRSSASTGPMLPSMGTSGVLLPTPTVSDIFTGNLKSSQQKDHTKHSVNLSQALNHPLFSPEASLASLSLKPDEGAERKTTASSGRKCAALLESSSRPGSLLRTCVASLLKAEAWYSSVSALTWKHSATKSSRLLFQLSPSARLIAETGSGSSPAGVELIPTPNASEAVKGRDRPRPSELARHTPSLGVQVALALLKTPSASDPEGGVMEIRPGTTGKYKLRDQIPHATGGAKAGLRLQPAFVEWMMGYPEGWTEIPDSRLSEMRLSRKSQKKS